MSADRKYFTDSSHWIALLIAFFLFFTWELATSYNSKMLFFISCPTQIFIALKNMLFSENLLIDIAITAIEAIAGTAIGTMLGSAVGLALWLSKRVAHIASPFVVVAANYPVFALAPVAIVWLGIGIKMKIFLGAFATFFISLDLTHHGAKVAQENYGNVFDGFRASYWDTYRKIIVPGAIDSVFSSMRVSVGLGILGAFIGEFIASDRGLGRVILRASGLYQVDRVFAASFCLVALAALLNKVALRLEENKLFIARWVGIPRRLRVRSKELVDNILL